MVRHWKSGLAVVVFCLYAATANAYVIQETSDALSFNNIDRGGPVAHVGPVTKGNGNDGGSGSTSGSLYMGKHEDDGDKKIDTKAIADKMLPEQPVKTFSLNLSKSSVQNIRLPRNYILQISLPEQENTYWHIDTEETIIKPLSSKLEKGMRVLEFQPVRLGTTKIFLDNIANPKSIATTETSRILRVKIIR